MSDPILDSVSATVKDAIAKAKVKIAAMTSVTAFVVGFVLGAIIF